MAGLHLGHQLLRPVGSGARKGPGWQSASQRAYLQNKEPQSWAGRRVQPLHNAPAQQVDIVPTSCCSVYNTQACKIKYDHF